MDYEDEDFNPDHNSPALDNVTDARVTLRGVLDLVISTRIDNGTIAGRTLDHVREHLLKIERDLSRATGELLR